MLSRMELRHVRLFLSLSKTLNFSRTAEIVHLSQPALSLQIQALEEEIGGKLFERDRRKTVLTASFHILPRLLEKIRSALPLVNVELKEGPEDPKITGLRSAALMSAFVI